MIALLQCDPNGQPMGNLIRMSNDLIASRAQSADLYRRVGYQYPWVSYVASVRGCGVGGGAFVGAPRDGLVEIAYFTLQESQGRGYATQIAQQLVEIARKALRAIVIRAFTLPEESPSTKILRGLGFANLGERTTKMSARFGNGGSNLGWSGPCDIRQQMRDVDVFGFSIGTA
jgi:[ribosomal protein S5]-alanine N-acetyltransferase